MLHPTERTILAVTAALAMAGVILALSKGIALDAGFFTFSLGFAVLMIGIGQIYRRYRDSERIALTTHMLGMFVIYSAVGAFFNVMLLPRPSSIDAYLVAIDARLGYSWPALCAWLAGYPVLNDIVRTIYTLTLVQLLVAFILLGMSLDRRRLHIGALAVVLASLVTIFFWALFPSGGTTMYWTLDSELERTLQPIVTSNYGAELARLFQHGVTDMSAIGITGLIGCPSFHTVMALAALIAVWPYRLFRAVYLVVAVLLVPGILVHGGHHLVDMLAGVAVTVASWLVAARIFDAQERMQAASRALPSGLSGQADPA